MRNRPRAKRSSIISASWIGEGDQGQIVITYGRKRSGKLTRLGSGFTGDRDGQGVGVENAEDEGDKGSFGEHGDSECRERGMILTAPGLKFLW